MSTKDTFERLYGGIPVTELPFVDTVSIITNGRHRTVEEQARLEEAAKELRRLAMGNPVTLEGWRHLHRRRREPPLHNIPMPRTAEGDRFRAVIHKMRKETWPETFTFMTADLAGLEQRLVAQQERDGWTLQDCHWRDGEE